MKIGIDARFYGARAGGGGIGRYVAELLKGLGEIENDQTYTLFLQKHGFLEATGLPSRFQKTLADIPWYGLKEQLLFPRLVKQARVDLFHAPHWNVPLLLRQPFIVTIHDLILLEDPSSAHATTHGRVYHALKFAGFRLALEHAIYGSRKIITISEASREAILRHFRVPEKKIAVIPNGFNAITAERSESLTTHGVYAPYFLAVGNAYPHKNLEFLIRTFHSVTKRHPHAMLVIAGKRDTFSRDLERLGDELGIAKDRLRFVDHPSDDLLARLYAEALALVFPSKLEGFGLPPLEALAHNTPVFSSNRAPMPDLYKDAALYFDPEDHDDLLALLLTALENPDTVRARLSRARDVLATYSWKKTAEQTKAVYDEVLATL